MLVVVKVNFGAPFLKRRNKKLKHSKSKRIMLFVHDKVVLMKLFNVIYNKHHIDLRLFLSKKKLTFV